MCGLICDRTKGGLPSVWFDRLELEFSQLGSGGGVAVPWVPAVVGEGGGVFVLVIT